MDASPVVRSGELASGAVDRLLAHYGLLHATVAAGQPIPGSYWGAPEAGLVGRTLYLRADTPVHSLLHELAHFVCMSAERRAGLHTDAGGDADEECAVCYLQVLLADRLPDFGASRCLDDMTAWGYSFREGTAHDWFSGDGRDARAWLRRQGLVDADDAPSFALRA